MLDKPVSMVHKILQIILFSYPFKITQVHELLHVNLPVIHSLHGRGQWMAVEDFAGRWSPPFSVLICQFTQLSGQQKIHIQINQYCFILKRCLCGVAYCIVHHRAIFFRRQVLLVLLPVPSLESAVIVFYVTM